MYESPVKLIMSDIKLQVDEKLEEACYTAVMDYFPNVNREELIRALQYDRQQYEQGYRDAQAEIVHCEECIHSGMDGYCCCGCGQMPPHFTYPDLWCSYGEKEVSDG